MKKVRTNPTGLAALALAAVLVATPAAAQQVDTRAEKELIAHGQKIDRTSASGESSRVTDKIVAQWSGTQFRFDADPAVAPRDLKAEDVQSLRQQKLGYGEITILLALTANQPDSATALSLNEILALRQAGGGWGKIARDLGYQNLGSVIKSVKATGVGVEKVTAGGKVEKVGGSDTTEKMSKPERPQKLDKPERIRVEKPQRLERPGR